MRHISCKAHAAWAKRAKKYKMSRVTVYFSIILSAVLALSSLTAPASADEFYDRCIERSSNELYGR